MVKRKSKTKDSASSSKKGKTETTNEDEKPLETFSILPAISQLNNLVHAPKQLCISESAYSKSGDILKYVPEGVEYIVFNTSVRESPLGFIPSSVKRLWLSANISVEVFRFLPATLEELQVQELTHDLNFDFSKILKMENLKKLSVRFGKLPTRPRMKKLESLLPYLPNLVELECPQIEFPEELSQLKHLQKLVIFSNQLSFEECSPFVKHVNFVQISNQICKNIEM